MVWDYAGFGSGPVTFILPHMVVQHYNTLPGKYTAFFVRQVGGLWLGLLTTASDLPGLLMRLLWLLLLRYLLY